MPTVPVSILLSMGVVSRLIRGIFFGDYEFAASINVYVKRKSDISDMYRISVFIINSDHMLIMTSLRRRWIQQETVCSVSFVENRGDCAEIIDITAGIELELYVFISPADC